MYARIAFSIALRYRNACSPTLTTNQNVADTNGPSEAVSKRAYTSGVCTSVHMQHVSKSARVLWGRYMQQFKAIFWREITYLSNLLETVLFYCERQENSHASWLKSLPLGDLANTLRGAAILKVSESLIFSRKSSRRIYGKWESWDGKRSSSAGYSVITVFCHRQATVSGYCQGRI